MSIIDSDAHVIESEHTWSYLAQNERHFAPLVLDMNDRERGAETGVANKYWYSGHFIQTKDNEDLQTMDTESREMGRVNARLKHMDELNIDIQVLYPTIFLAPCTRDADQQAAQYRAYNRWLSDIWKLAGGRLRWAACVPTYSMHLVKEELNFAKKNGACAVFIRPFECDRYVGDSYFTPLFNIAEELDLAIAFHSGNASYQNNIFHEGHNFGRFKLAMIAQFHWLLEYELPKNYPKLRWAFIEAAASWIPYALQDLESRMERKGKKLSENPLKENNIWVTVETRDDVPYIIQRIGDENLLIGTDYGHTDTSAQIAALSLLRENKNISLESVNRILDFNPRKLYGI